MVKTDNAKIREELVAALAKSPLLRFLGQSGPQSPELRDMLTSSEVARFGEGQVIIKEGDTSDRMYLLAAGTVRVSVNDSEICTMDQPGEVFGEFGALTGELRTATVTAVTEVTCLAVSSLFTSRIALSENSLFAQLVQRALTKALLGRLKQTSSELATTHQALEAAERQASFLRMDNEQLTADLDDARKQLREGLRGTRAGGDAKS